MLITHDIHLVPKTFGVKIHAKPPNTIMNIILHILHASKDLDPFIESIERNFSLAVKKITAKLPVSNIDVVVANNPQGVIPEIGIGGRTYNAHFIYLSVNAKFPNLKNSLSEHLERTLAHELHHCSRWSTVGYGKTLLEAMIPRALPIILSLRLPAKKRVHGAPHSHPIK